MDTSANEYLKGAIEALLFISEKPVALDQLTEVIQEGVGQVDVRKLVTELQEEYEAQQRGMVIVEIAGGFQMLSSSHYVSFVRSFLKTKVKEKLSRPALEALAIVAYKQPVSRGDIELVRGVNSDGVVLHLLDKGLIKIVGKKDAPGRPYLYGTAKLFLEYFGLKSLRDLPKLEDVSLLLANSSEIDNVETQQSTIEKSEESGVEVSEALDHAEAIAAKESLAAQELSEESAEMAQPIDQHMVVEQNNVTDILPEEIAVVTEEPQTLKQAMEDISRGELKSQEDFSSIDAHTVKD
ncbi:MAG: SMC-Scp complex subunit ScpB [Candidatus Omnitrophica bacterium]|nr:SMC-Scp complex subunit ScpB [Candidatus Omnitrophota bacterium]